MVELDGEIFNRMFGFFIEDDVGGVRTIGGGGNCDSR